MLEFESQVLSLLEYFMVSGKPENTNILKATAEEIRTTERS